MNYLLDTHTLIWAITEKRRLSILAKQTIENIKSGFDLIPLLPADSASYHKLPYIGQHKDPFDRMLIWQAIHQDLV